MTNRPRVIVHNAISADGRNNDFPVDMGQYYDLIRTWREDATLVGADTILAAPDAVADEAAVAADPPPERDPNAPLLVVTDSRGRIRTWQYWRRQPYWRDLLVFCSRATPADYLAYLDENKVDYRIAGEDQVDLHAAFEQLLVDYGVEVIRVDSGGTLIGVLLRRGLVDEISLVVHPYLVGGLSTDNFFVQGNLAAGPEALPLKLHEAQPLENDLVWLRYEVTRSG